MKLNLKDNRVFTYILFVIVFLLLATIGVLTYQLYSQSYKICFVRSDDLIYNYAGTKEARVKFNNQQQMLQANLDTLIANYEKSYSNYKSAVGKLSSQVKLDWEDRLSKQENQIDEYAKAVEEKVKDEDAKMMQAVLNQINSFVKDYATRNGIDYILMSGSQGVVLHGNNELDITDKLLDELNKNYKGE